MKKISLASADIPLKAYFNIFDCLRSERIGRGKYVDKLEEMACKYFRVSNCIAVSSGTLADILVLSALKVRVDDPKKNQVIFPALTFVAHTNAALWAGLYPVFVDVNDDFQMDTSQVKGSINKNTLAVFPVHLMGVECKMPKVKLPILEDCCEAMGGQYANYGYYGTKGLASTFSMYPSHTITTGEGGLVLTNDNEFADLVRSIHNHGKIKGSADFNFNHIGINAKMTNLQAAIGCSVFETIDEVNEKRRENVWKYNELLGGDFYASAPHCYPVIYESMEERDKALIVLESNGIESRKLMSCVPNLKPYKDLGYSGMNLNAQRLADCGLFVPIHQKLKTSDIERICDVIIKSRQ
jgi:perosamine synthetase